MGPLERLQTTVNSIQTELQKVPEVAPAFEMLANGNGESITTPEVGNIYFGYMRIIRDLATLPAEDIALIKHANEESVRLGISNSSATHLGADGFLSTLGESGRAELFNKVLASSDTESPIFREALGDLGNRMKRGHERAINKEPNVDGNKEADKVIWGHTMGLQPEALIHFTMCHFLERTFAAGFSKDADPDIRNLAGTKDSLISAMGDVIKLRHAQNRLPEDLALLWENTRQNGGLEWNKPERQAVYDAVVNESNIRAGYM